MHKQLTDEWNCVTGMNYRTLFCIFFTEPENWSEKGLVFYIYWRSIWVIFLCWEWGIVSFVSGSQQIEAYIKDPIDALGIFNIWCKQPYVYRTIGTRSVMLSMLRSGVHREKRWLKPSNWHLYMRWVNNQVISIARQLWSGVSKSRRWSRARFHIKGFAPDIQKPLHVTDITLDAFIFAGPFPWRPL